MELEVKKENDKLLSIFNFLEDGTYTKEIFKERNDVILKNITRINNSIKEYKEKLINEKNADKEVFIPKIKNLLDVYDLLQTPEEKNYLLKTVLTQITYLKTEKSIRKDSDPTNFTIKLYPKINKTINK